MLVSLQQSQGHRAGAKGSVCQRGRPGECSGVRVSPGVGGVGATESSASPNGLGDPRMVAVALWVAANISDAACLCQGSNTDLILQLL